MKHPATIKVHRGPEAIARTIKAMSVMASPMWPSLISVPGLFPPAKSAPAEDHAVLRQSSLRATPCAAPPTTVPRQHREDAEGELLGLGSFISNTRRRAAKLSPERREALNA